MKSSKYIVSHVYRVQKCGHFFNDKFWFYLQMHMQTYEEEENTVRQHEQLEIIRFIVSSYTQNEKNIVKHVPNMFSRSVRMYIRMNVDVLSINVPLITS
jgi:hypothetical protein